jgi:ribosomal protein L37AE/L43A
LSSTALTAGERVDLTAAETFIEKGLETFIEVGQALAEIRDRRLYRADYSTFEECAHDRWLLSRTRAYQLIDAAAVSTIVDVAPANEAQARELARLKDDEPALMEVSRELHERHGAKITAHLIRREVDKQLERKPRVDCPGCPRHVLVDRIDAKIRPPREGWCPRCGNKMLVEDTISTTYEIDSEGKRQLAVKAVERFWNVVVAKRYHHREGEGPLHEVIHLDRALALLTDEEIAGAIGDLEKGIAETKTIVAILRRHQRRNGGSS